MSAAIIQVFNPAADPETSALVTLERWSEVTIVKQTTGTVLVGTNASLAPINAGLGMGLEAGEPLKLTLGPGTTLYAIAENDNQRLAVVVQPLPAAFSESSGGGTSVVYENTAGEPIEQQAARPLRYGKRDPRLGDPPMGRHNGWGAGEGRG